MVDRVECTFFKKAGNAQKLAAAGVVVADSTCLCIAGMPVNEKLKLPPKVIASDVKYQNIITITKRTEVIFNKIRCKNEFQQFHIININ
mmetsp:Transcript_5651/g.6268  ORF Transcript_5651/g.6268 Transcript_5651/m.6268 type:complete len:89 (+) Transcript_5651:1178-1444(+)